MLLGLACLTFLLFNLVQDLTIWVLGRPATAKVLELSVVRTNDVDEGELTFDYFVRFQFDTSSGKVITSTSRLDVREWGALNEGGELEVVYFPLYPQHNRIDESRLVSMLACAYLPFTLFTWASLGVGWYLIRPSQMRDWWFSRGADSQP
jgi:hypothetical protein